MAIVSYGHIVSLMSSRFTTGFSSFSLVELAIGFCTIKQELIENFASGANKTELNEPRGGTPAYIELNEPRGGTPAHICPPHPRGAK